MNTWDETPNHAFTKRQLDQLWRTYQKRGHSRQKQSNFRRPQWWKHPIPNSRKKHYWQRAKSIYKKNIQGRQYKRLGYVTKERMERAYKPNGRRQSCEADRPDRVLDGKKKWNGGLEPGWGKPEERRDLRPTIEVRRRRTCVH